MIFSYLSHCVTSWSQATASMTKPLQRLYNGTLKISNKRPFGSHHCHVLRDLNVLSLVNLYSTGKGHSCLEMFTWAQAPCEVVEPLHGVGLPARNIKNYSTEKPGQSSFLIKE